MRNDHSDSKLIPSLDLLGRYLEGRASATDTAAVERWLAADQRHREAFEELRWRWHTEGHARAPEFDAAGAWAGMPAWVRAGLRPPRTAAGDWAGRRRGDGKRWMTRVAAAAAAVLAAGLGFWLAQHRTAMPVPAPHDVAYATQRGELRSFTLDDGTRVFLGAASRLSAPAKFGAERVVTLDGEAYFDVVHDTTRPFSVRTAGMIVRDVGTSFGIRAFSKSAVREVAVRTGQVSVSAAKPHAAVDSIPKPTLLAPGMLLRIDGPRTTVSHADVEAYLGWMRGQLTFEDRPLREVLEDVERYYRLTIVLDDTTLAAGRVTAAFRSQSQAEIARVLAGAVGARVEQRGDTVYFRKRAINGGIGK